MPLLLTCKTSALRRANALVSPVVPSRTPRAILTKVLLQVTASPAATSQLTGTDGEVSIRANIVDPEMTTQPGSVLLNAGTLGKILSNVTSEKITIAQDDKSITIKTDSSEYKLETEDPDEYPAFPTPQGDPCELDRDKLARAIHLTKFCCDTESTRYALTGVFFDFTKNGLTLAATDARRLSCIPASDATYNVAGCVIPLKAIKSIETLLRDSEGPCSVHVGASTASFSTSLATVHSRLVEGRFPAYKDIIPTTFAGEVRFNRNELQTAVSQAAIMTSEESRGMDFVFAADGITLTTKTASAGNARIQIPELIEESLVGLTLTLDPRYVLQYLAVLESGDVVRLRMTNGEAAVLLSVDGCDGKYVVMPLSRN